jgi:nucleoside-diphosphate-sugar epimerase
MAPENKKILLTGATGFIGGSILSHLLNSPEPAIRDAQFSCLLRGADRAEKLSSAYGDRVKPILYEGNEDLDTIVAVAAQHDIVINATMGFHPPSAEALVKGLAKRQAATGHEVWIIHTSGVSNIGDKPITKPGLPIRIFDDSADDIYDHQKALENEQPYAQRTTELGVIDTGLALGVNTLSIMSPTIYGPGTGLFNQSSAQTLFLKATLDRKKASVIGDGESVHGHVHIADLVELYKIVLLDVLNNNGQHLPSGKKSIIFSSHGEHSKIREAKLVAAAGHELGLLPDETVEHLSPEVGAREILPHVGLFTQEQIEVAGPQIIEAVLAFNAETVPNVAYGLGWKPLRCEDAWEQAIKDDMKRTAVDLGLL